MICFKAGIVQLVERLLARQKAWVRIPLQKVSECSAAWPARPFRERKVGGSNPLTPTILKQVHSSAAERRSYTARLREFESLWTYQKHGRLAQSGEHLLCKQRVAGSIPAVSTILHLGVAQHGQSPRPGTGKPQVQILPPRPFCVRLYTVGSRFRDDRADRDKQNKRRHSGCFLVKGGVYPRRPAMIIVDMSVA